MAVGEAGYCVSLLLLYLLLTPVGSSTAAISRNFNLPLVEITIHVRGGWAANTQHLVNLVVMPTTTTMRTTLDTMCTSNE